MRSQRIRWGARAARLCAACALALVTLVLAACGGDDGTTGGSTSATATNGDASGSAALEAAKRELTRYTTPQTDWTGPTSGPRVESGKRIAFVSYDQKNLALQSWYEAVRRAAAVAGWSVTLLDGQGTTQGQQGALGQALALKPDGVVLGAMPTPNRSFYPKFRAAGIPVVGLTSAPSVGAFPDDGIFWNVNQDPQELGKAMGDWMVVDSDGKARIVLISDKAFEILTAKTAGMREAFAACPDCELLLDTQVPIADAQSRLPTLVTGWVQKYGTSSPLYIAQGSDYYTDFEIPSLRSAGVQQGQVVLSGMDGAPAIYKRIRADDAYQEVSMPIPYGMQGFEAIDQLNRAMHDQEPADFASPVYVLDKTNVDQAGGQDNVFDPPNGYAQHYEELWTTGRTS